MTTRVFMIDSLLLESLQQSEGQDAAALATRYSSDI